MQVIIFVNDAIYLFSDPFLSPTITSFKMTA